MYIFFNLSTRLPPFPAYRNNPSQDTGLDVKACCCPYILEHESPENPYYSTTYVPECRILCSYGS